MSTLPTGGCGWKNRTPTPKPGPRRAGSLGRRGLACRDSGEPRSVPRPNAEHFTINSAQAGSRIRSPCGRQSPGHTCLEDLLRSRKPPGQGQGRAEALQIPSTAAPACGATFGS